MVQEIKGTDELRECISKNRLVLLAVTNKDKEDLWRYIMSILMELEQMARPQLFSVITHYQIIANELKPYEIDQAKRSVIIKLFLDGRCIFEQEGILGMKLGDETVLKRGIRESLKPYSIDIRFITL